MPVSKPNNRCAFRNLQNALANHFRTLATRAARALALLTAAFFALTFPAHAQESASADSAAFLVTPLSFVKETDLDFGDIIPGDTDGTVFMDSTGAISTTGGVIHVEGTQQPARFYGFGAQNQRVLINVDANSYTLTRSGGTEEMLYDQVTIGSRPPILITTNPRRFRIIGASGAFAFTIAGRLRIGANQAPGVYEGEFNVTLEYE